MLRLEIYNEKLRDLLVKSSSSTPKLRDYPDGTRVDGLNEGEVATDGEENGAECERVGDCIQHQPCRRTARGVAACNIPARLKDVFWWGP